MSDANNGSRGTLNGADSLESPGAMRGPVPSVCVRLLCGTRYV